MDKAGPPTGDHTTVPGRIIAPGIAFGFAHFDETIPVASSAGIHSGDVDSEIDRLNNAVSIVHRHLETHIHEVHAPAEEDVQQIIASHLLILQDKGFVSSITSRIEDDLVSAEQAVEDVFNAAADRLGATRDPYLRARAEDLRDICQTIRKALILGEKAFQQPDQDRDPLVLIAPHIHPSVVLRARRSGAVAFITSSNALFSHGAILLRAMGIPALGDVSLIEGGLGEGTPVLVDAVRGAVHLRPASETTKAASSLSGRLKQLGADNALPPLNAQTADGQKIRVRANIEHPSQASLCFYYRLDGIGLFRTEFMVLMNGHIPGEDAQFHAYRQMVEQMGGRPIVFRTFDIGGDKVTADLHHCTGTNPALGVRGVRRHLLRFPDELRTQLKAILRAALGADAAILLPMVTRAGDIVAVSRLLDEVIDELRRGGVPFNPKVRIGAMIEVPSAALEITRILEEVDFVSIGTNDLLQYLTASDRDNPEVTEYQNLDDSGLRPLLEHVMDRARALGRADDVSVCGEIASIPEGAAFLVELGITSLSMSPGAAPGVRQAIGSVHFHGDGRPR